MAKPSEDDEAKPAHSAENLYRKYTDEATLKTIFPPPRSISEAVGHYREDDHSETLDEVARKILSRRSTFSQIKVRQRPGLPPKLIEVIDYLANLISKSKYPARGVNKVICDILGEQTAMESSLRETMVLTYDAVAGLPKTFSSFETGKLRMADAARASSAAPTYFPPHFMEDSLFIDGGVYANNPVLQGIIRGMSQAKGRERPHLILKIKGTNFIGPHISLMLALVVQLWQRKKLQKSSFQTPMTTTSDSNRHLKVTSRLMVRADATSKR